MKLILTVLAFGFVFIPALPAFAGLDWEDQRINHTAPIMEEKAEVGFAFTNTGDQAVTIESVRTSCGCTTAKLEKKIYQPGESGKLNVVFAYGDRSGTQHKRITVRTSTPPAPGGASAGGLDPATEPANSDAATGNTSPGKDGDNKPVVEDEHLYLKVTIPQPVKVRPRMLYWKVGEDPLPKTARITINYDSPVKIGDLKIAGRVVSAELKTIEEGKLYDLILTPRAEEDLAGPVVDADVAEPEADAEDVQPIMPPTSATVSLKADFGDDQSRIYKVLARVLRDSPEKTTPAAAEPDAKQTAIRSTTTQSIGTGDEQAAEQSKPDAEATATPDRL